MKIYILNHTAKSPHRDHPGSVETMKALYKLLEDHKIIGRHCSGLGVDYKLLKEADFVICNGEGTMHHNSKSMRRIMAALTTAQGFGKKTALINSVWDSNDDYHKETLEKLDFLSFREELSQKSAGLGVVRADLVFNNDYDIPEKTGKNEVFTDDMFYSGTFQELINKMADCGRLITSKYHGVILALISGTRFEVVLGANSHKIKGLLIKKSRKLLTKEELFQ